MSLRVPADSFARAVAFAMSQPAEGVSCHIRARRRLRDTMTPLTGWESFYVIVGSSGGALIGLQFVVITLIADRRDLATGGALSAFGTPTVVHFTGALLVSAIMSAPWPSLLPLSIALAICGLGGLAYGAIAV